MSVHYPALNIEERFISSAKTMLEKGQDPKNMLIEVCKPRCEAWKSKLERCELKLKELNGADPEKSCVIKKK